VGLFIDRPRYRGLTRSPLGAAVVVLVLVLALALLVVWSPLAAVALVVTVALCWRSWVRGGGPRR
jgi:hypothetical protein